MQVKQSFQIKRMARQKPTARMSTGGRPPRRSVAGYYRSARKAALTLLLVRNRGVGPLAKMPRDVVRIIARQIRDSCHSHIWSRADELLELSERKIELQGKLEEMRGQRQFRLAEKKTELKRELAEVEKELRERKEEREKIINIDFL